MKMLGGGGPEMEEKIKEEMQWYRLILGERFRQRQEEAIQVLLMLLVAHLFGCFTPNQLAQRLGIPKNRLYDALKGWSLKQWRRMLLVMGCLRAIERLRELKEKSPATWSRVRVTLSVDDSVIDRLGRWLGLTYSWWSGRAKRVVRGQNVLALVIRIGDEVIPLGIRIVSKQGRANTTKPAVFEALLDEVIALFQMDRCVHGWQFCCSL